MSYCSPQNGLGGSIANGKFGVFPLQYISVKKVQYHYFHTAFSTQTLIVFNSLSYIKNVLGPSPLKKIANVTSRRCNLCYSHPVFSLQIGNSKLQKQCLFSLILTMFNYHRISISHIFNTLITFLSI